MSGNALVRRVGESWSSPSRRGFGLEVELEQLIHDYPEVLPGVSAAAIAVTQFSVPSGGSVDLVILEPDATVTIVECKLAKNAEVRRAVVGQILSYASSLTLLDVEGFLDQFDRRLGGSVIELLTPGPGTGESEDWDEARFHTSLTRTLADGAFRLVIAVDRITDELRGIVEYLNTRTDERVEVLALEVDLIAYEGVEVLIPRVHGLESSRLKGHRGSGSRGTSRDLETALAAFDDAFTSETRSRIESLFADLREAGGQLRPGTGAEASVIGVLRTSKGVRSVDHSSSAMSTRGGARSGRMPWMLYSTLSPPFPLWSRSFRASASGGSRSCIASARTRCSRTRPPRIACGTRWLPSWQPRQPTDVSRACKRVGESDLKP